MSRPLWPIEIECDAPAYPFVRASRQAGIRAPEDVRWLRLSRVCGPDGQAGRATGAETCRCGARLPSIWLVGFATSAGGTLSLLLAQCSRCHTVFWDQAR